MPEVVSPQITPVIAHEQRHQLVVKLSLFSARLDEMCRRFGGQRRSAETAHSLPSSGFMKITSPATLPQGFRSIFLDGLTPREITTAITTAKQERIAPHQIVQQEGDQAIRFWLLVTGLVAVYSLASGGDKVFLRWGVPGDTFGLATTLGRPDRYIVTIEAVQEGSLLAWDLASSQTLISECPNLSKALNAVLSKYLHDLINVLGIYALPSAEQRLARVLAESARQLGRKEDGRIELDLTNEQLAMAAHMTVFTATRKLTKWQRLGILTKRRGRIVLPSLSRFEGLTDNPGS
jgi:CRP/FNR family transcriptional regulator, nitrogen oxide reductase regulator